MALLKNNLERSITQLEELLSNSKLKISPDLQESLFTFVEKSLKFKQSDNDALLQLKIDILLNIRKNLQGSCTDRHFPSFQSKKYWSTHQQDVTLPYHLLHDWVMIPMMYVALVLEVAVLVAAMVGLMAVLLNSAVIEPDLGVLLCFYGGIASLVGIVSLVKESYEWLSDFCQGFITDINIKAPQMVVERLAYNQLCDEADELFTTLKEQSQHYTFTHQSVFQAGMFGGKQPPGSAVSASEHDELLPFSLAGL